MAALAGMATTQQGKGKGNADGGQSQWPNLGWFLVLFSEHEIFPKLCISPNLRRSSQGQGVVTAATGQVLCQSSNLCFQNTSPGPCKIFPLISLLEIFELFWLRFLPTPKLK